MQEHFSDKLIRAMRAKDSILVVGLDPQLRYMPRHLAETMVEHYGRSVEAIARTFIAFNRDIIDAVCDYACAVKPQMAFYEAYGHWGVYAFEKTVEYAKAKGLIIIEDAKRGDGGDTADAYADGHIGEVPYWGQGSDFMQLTRRRSPIRVDCMTVHGYIGDDCITRFVKPVMEHRTGIFVVDKTSFKPNSRVEELVTESGTKVWESLAYMVNSWGSDTEGFLGYRNVGVVMGATKPNDAPTMRQILPRAIFLVPGYGTQGGGADEAVIGVNHDGLGCVVNSSRGIINAYLNERYKTTPEEFALAAGAAAVDAKADLNNALKRAGKHRS